MDEIKALSEEVFRERMVLAGKESRLNRLVREACPVPPEDDRWQIADGCCRMPWACEGPWIEDK